MFLVLFIFAVFTIITAVSIFAHEYGHILMARRLGYNFLGFHYHWSGIGAKIEIDKEDKNLWKIALAGLIVTFVLTLAAFPFASIWFINYLFVLNFLILLINIIPVGPTDGRIIYKKIKYALRPNG